MKVDVIIPTYNRGSKILELLDSLLNQSFKRFGVIIINDGSTDGTENYILDFINKHQKEFEHFKYINILNSGRSIVRNIGIKNSTADILIFFDDDVRPGSETILRHVQFQTDNSYSILYGPSLYDSTRIVKRTFQDFRKQYEESWYKSYENVDNPIEVKLTGINGGNFSVRRCAFKYVKGFDINLKDSEDFKLAYDLINNHNFKIFFDYRAWIYHDDFRPFLDYVNRRREARLAAKKMIELYPDILNKYKQKYQFNPPKNRRYFFELFRSNIFKSKLCAIILEKLPISLQYKLYDIIITSNCIYLD